MKRRSFISSASVTALASSIGLAFRPNAVYAAGKRLRWRLALCIPRTLPIWGAGIERFADNVEALTAGGLKIKVYGAGELVPALETFEAVRSGKIQMGHSAAYYWQGKIAAAPFFTATPFSAGVIETLSWLAAGGGQTLYDQMYKPFGVKAFPCGAVPAQMTGWFKKPIQSPADLKGLKIRVPGFASAIYESAGASPVLMPGGEVFTSLSTGVIDAVEWVGPYHDYVLGLHKAAQYYYGPGWQEQGSVLELMINAEQWNTLPEEYQQAIQICGREATLWMLEQFHVKNIEYLKKIEDEGKTSVGRLPDSVITLLREKSKEVIGKITKQDPLAAKVYADLSAYQQSYRKMAALAEI